MTPVCLKKQLTGEYGDEVSVLEAGEHAASLYTDAEQIS